ncbi:MAG: rhodanese-like domain-containing protein [Cytophagaceae bacterium]|nr:rhodanese-like domain-containing protein [Cytophagaceae bacterium]MDW8455749.1 rhodanese-like domain-containing protein [Cytophagaceae bacterium]
MMETIKNILGLGSSVNFADLLAKGAIIVDVRTPEEYKNGHIRGSINIPLGTLEKNLSKINKNAPVITCCASGMRSASAKSILLEHGYKEVYNGGGWMSLKNKLS